jgi:hypothetical protein
MSQNAAIDFGETRIVDVEPVEVAVEDDADRSRLAGGHGLDRLQRGQVAVAGC